MSEQDKIFGDLDYHEVLDRSSLVMELWDTSVLEHPLVADTPELLKEAEAAHQALFDFYQNAGEIVYARDNSKETPHAETSLKGISCPHCGRKDSKCH